MPKIDIDAVPVQRGSSYPEPHAAEMGSRAFRDLGDAAGLTQFGACLVTVQPGSKSSLRHWHSHEDEFAWIVSGELVLVEDDGETPVRPGDAIGWPSNTPNGHHLLNRSDAEATFLVIGTRAPDDACHYSDVDMIHRLEGDRSRFTRRDGAPVE